MFILLLGYSLNAASIVHMNNRRNLFFYSIMTLNSVHHMGSFFSSCKIEPVIDFFFLDRASERTEPLTTLDCIDMIFTIFDSRIKQNRSVAKCARTTFRTTLVDSNDVTFTNQFCNIIIRSVGNFQITQICKVFFGSVLRTIVNRFLLTGFFGFFYFVVDVFSTTNRSTTVMRNRFAVDVEVRELLPILVVCNAVETITTTNYNILFTSQLVCFANQLNHTIGSLFLNLVSEILLNIRILTFLVILNVLFENFITRNIEHRSVRISRNNQISITPLAIEE